MNTMFGPMLNCFIHTLMYAYYGAVGVGAKLAPLKALMTSAQMAQFVVILVHSVFHIASPGKFWPVHLAWVQLALMFQMLYMFGDFFRTSYMGNSAKGAKGAREAAKGD
jgi:hypothetical protein